MRITCCLCFDLEQVTIYTADGSSTLPPERAVDVHQGSVSRGLRRAQMVAKPQSMCWMCWPGVVLLSRIRSLLESYGSNCCARAHIKKSGFPSSRRSAGAIEHRVKSGSMRLILQTDLMWKSLMRFETFDGGALLSIKYICGFWVFATDHMGTH